MRLKRKGEPLSRALKHRLAVMRVSLSAALRHRKLPPGSLQPLSDADLVNPTYLLEQAKRHGPIFKVWLDGKMTTYIVGFSVGRRFLAEHQENIRAATTDFRPLFPLGTLRQMTGAPHQNYRRIFVDAFKKTKIEDHHERIGSILDGLIQSLVNSGGISVGHIRNLLKQSLTEIFLLLHFGLTRDQEGLSDLVSLFERYAPNGTFVTVRSEHHETYQSITSLIHAHAVRLRNVSGVPSLLKSIDAAGQCDDTSIGNLVQMTEAGRFDVMGLWVWLVRLLGNNNHYLDALADAPDQNARAALSKAIVLEALRLEQSEFVIRAAKSNLVLDGYFIPKRTRIKIAVWESHKDSASFEDPFRFEPERFLTKAPSSDAYAPFGLDRHHCVGADWVVTLSSQFVEILAEKLRWKWTSGPSVERGVFHFQPDSSAIVKFSRAGG
jgi:cytochrome P450